MALETGQYIADLVPVNPDGASPVSNGDDHLRLVKRCTQNSFGAFVGTEAVPASVTLTEAQINLAAIKDEANTFTAVNTFEAVIAALSSIRINNNQNIQWKKADNSVESMMRLSTGDIFVIGSNNVNYQQNSLVYNRINIGGSRVAQFDTNANGSLLINDIDNVIKKAGFRNPSRRLFADVSETSAADWEAQVVEFVPVTPGRVCTIANLSSGTTYRIINTGTESLQISGTLTLHWLDGGGSAVTGTRALAPNSVVEIYHSASSNVQLFGNGLS